MKVLILTNNNLTTNNLWIMFSIGCVCLVLAIMCTIFYIWFKKRRKVQKDSFESKPQVNKIFRFWQHYAIIIAALSFYLATIIMFAISIPEFIMRA